MADCAARYMFIKDYKKLDDYSKEQILNYGHITSYGLEEKKADCVNVNALKNGLHKMGGDRDL